MDVRPSRLHRTVPAPPRRIVHLGLGAFSRSHTAWYTAAAADAAEWGISAYSGRSRELADLLQAQDGLYTLVDRDEDGDRAEVIESIVSARSGEDLTSLVADLADPATAIVTLTITEVGYRLGADGGPDQSDPSVVSDTAALRATTDDAAAPMPAGLRTVLGRLLLGLEMRRRRDAGPLAVMSCDNLPDNGGRAERGLLLWAEDVSAELATWMRENITFVSSSVDRITPRIDDAERATLALRYGDAVPVVAEPFRDWVICGEFPAGRPAWEQAGARFVDDLDPWEARKLWMLNGAHTLLACLGLLRGYTTVAEAIADPTCRAAVEELWDEAQRNLPPTLAIGEYRAALVRRFANPRIEHRLAQIATDSQTKVALRVVPVVDQERRAGRVPVGGARAIASWIEATRSGLVPGAAGEHPTSTAGFLALVGGSLSKDADFVASVNAARRDLIGNR